MMKVSLHDGEKKVRTIAIVLYLRNTGEYLRTFLIPTLTKFENIYDCTFYYYIFENDSIDDTVSLLQEFMSNRKGIFITKKLNLNSICNGEHISRIRRMAYIRNLLLNNIRGELIKHDWCLFIDADIYFDNNILVELMSKIPKARNIGMLTCNSNQLTKIIRHSYTGEERISYENYNHYYDTFACITKEDIFNYPNCISADCKHESCKYKQSMNKHMKRLKSDDSDPLDVRSAWGGFVLIDASVFRYPNIRWKTHNIDTSAICEHVYLCDMIHGITNKRIVICGDISCYWIV